MRGGCRGPLPDAARCGWACCRAAGTQSQQNPGRARRLGVTVDGGPGRHVPDSGVPFPAGIDVTARSAATTTSRARRLRPRQHRSGRHHSLGRFSMSVGVPFLRCPARASQWFLAAALDDAVLPGDDHRGASRASLLPQSAARSPSRCRFVNGKSVATAPGTRGSEAWHSAPDPHGAEPQQGRLSPSFSRADGRQAGNTFARSRRRRCPLSPGAGRARST